MAAGVREVIDNTVMQIEALTAATRYGNTLKFKHVDSVVDGEDLTDARSNSRKFVLLPTGSRSLVGFLGQEGEMTSVQQTIDLTVAYPVGRKTFDLFKVVAEDVDAIGRQLMKGSLFDSSNTGLERRRVEGYNLDMDDPGGTALVTIPIDVRYTPDHS